MLPTIHIIYASTSGNVEAVCEKTTQLLEQTYFETKLHRAEVTKIETLINNTHFILATSTWEHGVINPYFDNLLQGIKNHSMNEKNAGFIGLGDTRYEPVLFCEGINTLEQTFLESGGQKICETLKIDGDPYGVLESTVTEWTTNLISELSSNSVQ